MSDRLPVNKADLIDVIADSADITKASAAKVMNNLLESITMSLQHGKQVSILGFGTFSVKARAARTGRNPQTGAAIQILAANIPGFKAGKALKDAVNSCAIINEEAEVS